MNDFRFKKAFLTIVRRYITTPPNLTNKERLFSFGGLLLKKICGLILAEKVDYIIYWKESILAAFLIYW